MGIRESLIIRWTTIGKELEVVTPEDRHIQYKQGLYEELLAIDQLLSSPNLDLTAGDIGNVPFELETRGLT